MQLYVRHTSEYTYDQPVGLKPHTLYLYPRPYPHQRLLRYELTIDPTPTQIVRNVDVESNVQQVVYFAGQTQHLNVTMEMEIESNEFNSLNFIFFPYEAHRVPFVYPESIRELLLPYLSGPNPSTLVDEWARGLVDEANGDTVDFLLRLNRSIRQFRYEVRPEGPPFAPEHTLVNRTGSCRDYTTLFMAACRSLGIAARFVSGYLSGNSQQEHQLHAWAEVYLPGAGWRGFDPTENELISNRHIFLTSTAKPELAAPISGTFTGKAQSTFRAELLINNGQVPNFSH